MNFSYYEFPVLSTDIFSHLLSCGNPSLNVQKKFTLSKDIVYRILHSANLQLKLLQIPLGLDQFDLRSQSL